MEVKRSDFEEIRTKNFRKSIELLIKQDGYCTALKNNYIEVPCRKCPFFINNVITRGYRCANLKPDELYELAKEIRRKFLSYPSEEEYIY